MSNLPHLIQHTRQGRSLIFVRTSAANDMLCKQLKAAGIPYYSTEHEYSPPRAALQFGAHMMKSAVVLVATLPALVTGIRIPCDRIIWIGPHQDDDPIYIQATRRSNVRTPVFHFDEQLTARS